MANINDLSDALSDLTATEWRALLASAAQHRCIRCGEQDGCVCSSAEEVAVAIVLSADDPRDEHQRATGCTLDAEEHRHQSCRIPRSAGSDGSKSDE